MALAVMRGNEELKVPCDELHDEILCRNGNSDNCSTFCKNKFGPNTNIQCITRVGLQAPYCACIYSC